MKRSAAVAERLLTAIEQFVARETILSLSGNCAGMAATAARSAPLTIRLGALCAADSSVRSAVRPRVAALLEKRRQNQERLSARRVFLQDELQRVGDARRRLRDLAPVYGRPSTKPKTLARLKAAV